MRIILSLSLSLSVSVSLLVLTACNDTGYRIHYSTEQVPGTKSGSASYSKTRFKENSWQYFLQQLPVVDSPVLDYTGKKVRHQFKSAGVIPYDVGTADLQQCADAIMRLRAEYLFNQKQYDKIGFHFVNGQFYNFNDYCAGKKPVPSGNNVKFVTGGTSEKNHASLRKYLDLVYTYASTISLAKELKTATDFEVGTIVIYAGSPGHCFIIIDEMQDAGGKKLFRLAEGYTPAQSIYVLKNSDGTPWHELSKGPIETASYVFTSYELKKFE
jgi:hypothetical protein